MKSGTVSLVLILLNIVGLAIAVDGACDLPAATYQHKLSACTMVFNEGTFIEEWLSYHLLIGVDHFYIYDDGSTDHTHELLQPYIKQGMTLLHINILKCNILSTAKRIRYSYTLE